MVYVDDILMKEQMKIHDSNIFQISLCIGRFTDMHPILPRLIPYDCLLYTHFGMAKFGSSNIFNYSKLSQVNTFWKVK